MFQFPECAVKFSARNVQAECGVHSSSYLIGAMKSFSGEKAAGAWSLRLIPSRTKVKNEWSYTSTPPYEQEQIHLYLRLGISHKSPTHTFHLLVKNLASKPSSAFRINSLNYYQSDRCRSRQRPAKATLIKVRATFAECLVTKSCES
jgi:hypothetical protein